MGQFEDLVHKERIRQDDKWGIQNHNPERWSLILGEEYGELQKAILEDACFDMEDELVQVAAVAKAMWESGKRNGWI